MPLRRIRPGLSLGASLVLGLAALGCGPRLVLRPLELELVGLSSQAEVLTAKLADPSSSPPCAQLNPANAFALEAAASGTWRRDAPEDRRIDLDGIGLDVVQVVIVASDAAGIPIQVGCEVYRYEDLERPERSIELRMRPG